jgi:hypothetical protein
MSLNLEIGLNAIRNYRRMAYEIWYALAEFVDNSTQSFFNNRAALEEALAREGEGLEVRISYDRDQGLLRVVDNAMGMDYAELEHALKIASPPFDRSGRCRYGMGLKTSACWIGNKWIIKTKKLGGSKEYTVEIDVEHAADGNSALPTKVVDGIDPNQHYTILEIRDHNREFKGRTIGKIKDHLRSMYRQDFRNGTLSLYYGPEKLEWEDFDSRLRENRAGEVYRRGFEFTVNGKVVRGWAGILDRGARADAGFSILYRDRVVKGWPESWRPERIFGQNRNDLLNQRLIGEIHLDDFEVTHTKDGIQWYGDEEEEVEKGLEDKIKDLISIARIPWKNQEDERRPSDGEIDIAVSALREELTSQEMIDQIEITVIPPEEAVKESLSRIAEPVKTSRTPTIRAILGTLEVWVYVAGDMSPNDPYVVSESGLANKVIVIINTQHPHMGQLDGSVGVMNYFRHCIYDAIAEWQARTLRGRIDPETIKLLKDRLLRVSLIVEQHAQQEAAGEDAAAE